VNPGYPLLAEGSGAARTAVCVQGIARALVSGTASLLLVWALVYAPLAQARQSASETAFADAARARLEMAEAQGDARGAAAAKLDLAKHMLAKNLASQGLEFARMAREAIPDSRSDPLSLEIDIGLGSALQATGRTAEALDVLLEATSRAQQAGLVDLELRSRLNLSSTYGRTGRLDEAREQVDKGLALAMPSGNAEMQIRFLLNAARVSVGSGGDGAAALIDQAASIELDPPDPELDRMVLLAGVSAALSVGDKVLAMQRAERARAAAEAQGNAYYRAYALESIARIRCDGPEQKDARVIEYFTEAAATFSLLDQPHDGARVRRYWGRCLESLGKYQQALVLEREGAELQAKSHERFRTDAMAASESAFRAREKAAQLAKLQAEVSHLAQDRELQRARLAWLIASLAILGMAAVWQAARLRLLRANQDRERELAQQQAELLAITGHEIRNPMQCLIGILESGALQAKPGQDKALVSALSAARLVARLASDTLHLAKLEQGNAPASRSDAVELREMLAEVATLAAQSRQLPLQTVCIELGQGVPRWVSTDPSRLSQVLLNLIGNALAYSDEQPVVVRASLCAGGDRLVIQVRDKGPGFAAEELQNLGAAFRRGRLASRNPHGSGLGLAISKRLAHALGGELRLGNAREGGAAAELELPLDVLPMPMDESIETLQDAAPPTSLRVLLVDDDPLPRLGLATLLESLGCTVQQAENSDGLAAAVRVDRFDVVLLDLHLGVESGTTLARSLFAEGPWQGERPFLAIVSGDAEDVRLRSAHPMIDAWLAKPVSQQDAVGLLGKVLRKSAASGVDPHSPLHRSTRHCPDSSS